MRFCYLMKFYGFCFKTAQHKQMKHEQTFHNASWCKRCLPLFQNALNQANVLNFDLTIDGSINILLNLGLTIWWGWRAGVWLTLFGRLPTFRGGGVATFGTLRQLLIRLKSYNQFVEIRLIYLMSAFACDMKHNTRQYSLSEMT